MNFDRIKNQVSILDDESKEAARLLDLLYSIRVLAVDTNPIDRQIRHMKALKEQIQQRRQALEDILADFKTRSYEVDETLNDAIDIVKEL